MGESRAAGGGEASAPLRGDDLRNRVASGALLLGARGGLILVLGVGANILLARLLVPRDFGIVALGTVLLVVGGSLANTGLGAALIGRPDPPTRRQLEAVNGLQLALTIALALAFAGAAIPFGRDGLVVAAMVATLPITTLKTPAMIALERNLEYREIATVDIAEALVFYVWAVTTVALGMGVWGMASGMVVRAFAGTALMIRLSPLGFVRPRWDWAGVRPFLNFGLKIQAVTLVSVVRLQGINVAVAAIAGVGTLGVWNLAWRVLQVPYTLFATVGRVAYPTMSRLLASGEDPRAAMERGLATVAIATALVLVGIVGFAPALPELVGPEWGDVPATLLWSALGLIVGAPVNLIMYGYLYATESVGIVVRLAALQSVVWFAVTLPLLPEFGAPAVGVGSAAGAIASSALYARVGRRRTGARVVGSLAAPTVLAVVGGVLGWAIATAGDRSVLAGIAGAAAGEIVLVGGLMVVRRSLLRETYALLLRSARARSAPGAGVA
jgi:O-antigen/teichoic acid export membrane protein